MDDKPPSNKSLEEKLITMIEIKVEKNKEPILNPENYKGKYTSIRNPGATVYNGQTVLLTTVRHSKDNKSRLHFAKSLDGKNFELEKNPFIDVNPDSLLGVEDARITKIEDTYYITFTAFKEANLNYNTTRIGFVKTKDFKTYTDRKIILDEFANNKNAVIFKIDDYYYVIHRPFAGNSKVQETPAAQISKTKDFENFKNLGNLLEPRPGKWDNARVGVNTPPIKIKDEKSNNKLLMLYHGANKENNTYQIGYIIVDEKNPTKILERSEEPILSPELPWETQGETPNVVFGNGTRTDVENNIIRFFYAGSDKFTSYADLKLYGAKIQAA